MNSKTKNILACVGAIALAVAGVIATTAATSLGYPGWSAPNATSPVISSATTQTNQVPTITNNVPGIWPNGIYAGTTVTNFTPIYVGQGLHVAFQMDAQLTIAATASIPTNEIITIGRSISPPYNLTNNAGTGIKFESFATITNQFPGGTAANTTVTSHADFGPVTGYSSGAFDGPIPYYYIVSIQAPAGIALTNYDVWCVVQ